MLAAGGPEVHAVTFGGHLFERPDLGVEICRLMEIANAELDAADAGNFAVRHGDLVPSPGPANFAQSAVKGQPRVSPITRTRGNAFGSQPRQLGHHLVRE